MMRSFVVSLFLLFILFAVCGISWADEEDLISSENAGKVIAGPFQPGVLNPVPIPDVVNMEKTVQLQLEDLQRAVHNATEGISLSRKNLAKAYMALGEAYHAYEIHGAAEICYRNALAVEPSRPEMNYNLANLLQATGRFEEALPYYEKALAAAGPPEKYLIAIRQGECLRSLERFEEAENAYHRAAAIFPEGTAILARQGELALDNKRYGEAIYYLEKALKATPEATRLYYPLAMAYRNIGEVEKAREKMKLHGKVGVQPPDPVLERMGRLVSGVRVHVLEGKEAYAAGRYQEAAESFTKAVEADPKNSAAHINLGATLTLLDKPQNALEQFQKGVELDPENMTVRYNLGMLYAQMGDYDNAVKQLTLVTEKSPRDHLAHYGLAGVLTAAGNFLEAFEHYKQAARIEPSYAPAWIKMSSLLIAAGQDKEAISLLEEAHQRLPNNQPIMNILARLLAASPDLKNRNGKRAHQLASKAFSLNGTSAHARTIAMAHAEKGECKKAVVWQEKAVSLAGEGISEEVLHVLNQEKEHYLKDSPCRLPPQAD